MNFYGISPGSGFPARLEAALGLGIKALEVTNVGISLDWAILGAGNVLGGFPAEFLENGDGKSQVPWILV